eukprot:365865_1
MGVCSCKKDDSDESNIELLKPISSISSITAHHIDSSSHAPDVEIFTSNETTLSRQLKIRLLISGYIRQNHSHLIDPSITNICFKYYFIQHINDMKLKYLIGKKIGAGSYGIIRKCKRKSDGKMFAVKTISLKYLNASDKQGVDSEIYFLSILKHPNIVKTHEMYFSKNKVCYIMELLEGDTLFDVIVEHGKLDETYCSIYFKQMLSAVAYIHSMRIAHRSIRPEDFMFTKQSLVDTEIKLIDFGFAARLYDGNRNGCFHTPIGIPTYVAPEILKQQGYNTQCDLWSCGVVLYIMLCGFPPFIDECDDVKALYIQIKNGQYDMSSPWWDVISEDAKDLVDKLLQVDANKRLTANAALKHKWIVNC